jgi:hypothetical protein
MAAREILYYYCLYLIVSWDYNNRSVALIYIDNNCKYYYIAIALKLIY